MCCKIRPRTDMSKRRLVFDAVLFRGIAGIVASHQSSLYKRSDFVFASEF